MHLGVVGAGAWGTALACAGRRAGARVTIWAHEAETAEAIGARRANPVFLPGVALESGIGATTDMARLAPCDAVLLAAPSAHLRAVCAALAPHLRSEAAACVCAKGIEAGSGKLMTDVAREALGRGRIAVLSGPSFADEVARGLPTAVAAAGDGETLDRVVACLADPMFRVYRGSDATGVAVGGAVKNVIAIASGIAVGRGLGDNARAAAIGRGFAEMARLGGALGARRETLMGLSGLGDLVLTCTGERSRNHAFGRRLGSGRAAGEPVAGRAGVVEGAVTAPAVVRLAERLGVETPISSAVSDVLAGRLPVDDAIARLLARPVGDEFA